MGFLGFGSKATPPPEPVRADQVRRMIRLEKQLDECITFPGCPEILDKQLEQARAARDAAYRNASPAEIKAVNDQGW